MSPEKKSGSAGGGPVSPQRLPRLGKQQSDAHSTGVPEGTMLMPRGYFLTLPEDDTMYMIKEEQLAALSAGGRSASLDWGLGALGAAVGLSPQAISSLILMFNGNAIGLGDVASVCTVVALAVFALVKLHHHHANKADTSALLAKIEAGQKLRVGSTAEGQKP